MGGVKGQGSGERSVGAGTEIDKASSRQVGCFESMKACSRLTHVLAFSMIKDFITRNLATCICLQLPSSHLATRG